MTDPTVERVAMAICFVDYPGEITPFSWLSDGPGWNETNREHYRALAAAALAAASEKLDGRA